ncbi:MAG: hypothetical protein QXW73_08060, partial [Nitrososphaerales archaeon]
EELKGIFGDGTNILINLWVKAFKQRAEANVDPEKFLHFLQRGGSCNFNGSGSCSPLSQPTYYACIDKNNDTDYSDSGEFDYEVLNMICCQSDADCSSLNCGNYTAYCNATKMCECKKTCTSTKDDCANGYCCRYEVDGTKICVGPGTIINHGGASYLCDPPEWQGSMDGVQSSHNGYSVLDLILNFFRSIFS